MTPSRRTLLGGLIATLAAPAIIRTPGLLMPVRAVRQPRVLMRITNADVQAALAQFNNSNPFLHYMNTKPVGNVRIRLPTDYAVASGRTA